MYKVQKCDDGTWMVCTDGDIICYTGQGDEQAKAEMIAAVLNTMKPNLENWRNIIETQF